MERYQILIIHGWLHSAERYAALKKDLEGCLGCSVKLFELPGFGETGAEERSVAGNERCIMDYYMHLLIEEIRDDRYDFIIGHSLGGNLILRAMSGMKLKATAILLSPAYDRISLIRRPILWIFKPLFSLLQKRETRLSVTLIKCFSLASINRWDKIDEIVVRDLFRCDPVIASRVIAELICRPWHVDQRSWKSAKPYLIIGEKDRLIPRKGMQMLSKDLSSARTIVIPGIGHTAITENYPELRSIICKIVVSSEAYR